MTTVKCTAHDCEVDATGFCFDDNKPLYWCHFRQRGLEEELKMARSEIASLRESLRRTEQSLDVAVHALAACEALKSPRVTKADMTTWGEKETPAEHAKKCGPFCKHVRLCPDCENIRGLCGRHVLNPDESYEWVET